ESDFFLKVADIRLTFEKGKGPRAEAVVIHQNGQNLRAARVVRAQPSAGELAEFAGDYYSEELGAVFGLFVKEGKLWIRYSKGELPLNPIRKDSFSAP